MHMLSAAERAAAEGAVQWLALLRGDGALCEVFEALHPYAVPRLPLPATPARGHAARHSAAPAVRTLARTNHQLPNARNQHTIDEFE